MVLSFRIREFLFLNRVFYLVSKAGNFSFPNRELWFLSWGLFAKAAHGEPVLTRIRNLDFSQTVHVLLIAPNQRR